MLNMCLQNSVNEKHLSGNTFSTCWNITTKQILLKNWDGNDALCPTKSSPEYIVTGIKIWMTSFENKDIKEHMIFQINITTLF